MKKIEFSVKHWTTGEDTTIKMNIYDVGDEVWVVKFRRFGRYRKEVYPFKLKVANQEWWSNNTLHPVYYDLVNPETKETVGISGTGNWHFKEIFETERQAIDDIIEFLTTDISYNNEYIKLGGKLSDKDKRRFKSDKKQLSFWKNKINDNH